MGPVLWGVHTFAMQSASGMSPLMAHYVEYRVNKYLAGARATKVSPAIPTVEPSALQPDEIDNLHDVDEKLAALRVAIMMQQQATMMQAIGDLASHAQVAINQPVVTGQPVLPEQTAAFVAAPTLPIAPQPHPVPRRALLKQHVVQIEMPPTSIVQGTRPTVAAANLLTSGPIKQISKQPQALGTTALHGDGSQSPILGSRHKNMSGEYATPSGSGRDTALSSSAGKSTQHPHSNPYENDLDIVPGSETVYADMGRGERDVMLDTTILLPPADERRGEARNERQEQGEHAFGFLQQAADEARDETLFPLSDPPASQTMIIPSVEAAEALMLFTNQPAREMPPLESIPMAQYTATETVLLADDGWDHMDVQEGADEHNDRSAEEPYQPLAPEEFLEREAEINVPTTSLNLQEPQEPSGAAPYLDVNAIVLLPLQTTEYTNTLSQHMNPQINGQLRVVDGRPVMMALSPKTVPEQSNEKEMTLHATQIRDEIEQTCPPPMSPIPAQRRYLEPAPRAVKVPEGRSAIGQLWPQDMDSTIGTFTNTAATQPPAAPAVRTAERLPQLRVMPTVTARARPAGASQEAETTAVRTSARIRSTPRSEISSIVEADAPPPPQPKKPKLKPSAVATGKLQLQGGPQPRSVKPKEASKDRSKMFARVPPPPTAARAPALVTAVVVPHVAPAYMQSDYSHTQEMELMDVLASSQTRLTRSRTLNALIEVCDTAQPALGNAAQPQRPQFAVNNAAPGHLSPMSAVSVSSIRAYKTADAQNAQQETFVDIDPFFGLALAMEDALDLAVPSGFDASWTSASHFESAQPDKHAQNQPVGGDLDSLFSQCGLITPEHAAEIATVQQPLPIVQPEAPRGEGPAFGGADSPPMDPRHPPLVDLGFDYD